MRRERCVPIPSQIIPTLWTDVSKIGMTRPYGYLHTCVLLLALFPFSVWKCRRKRQKIERLLHQLFRFLQRQPHTGIEFRFPVSPIGLPNMPASIR